MKPGLLILLGIAGIYLSSCNLKEDRRDRYFQEGNDALEGRAFQEARKFYDKALELDPDFSEAWNNKGIAFYEENKFVTDMQDNIEKLQQQTEQLKQKLAAL